MDHTIYLACHPSGSDLHHIMLHYTTWWYSKELTSSTRSTKSYNFPYFLSILSFLTFLHYFHFPVLSLFPSLRIFPRFPFLLPFLTSSYSAICLTGYGKISISIIMFILLLELLRGPPDYSIDIVSALTRQSTTSNYEWRTCPMSLQGGLSGFGTCNLPDARHRIHHWATTPHVDFFTTFILLYPKFSQSCIYLFLAYLNDMVLSCLHFHLLLLSL